MVWFVDCVVLCLCVLIVCAVCLRVPFVVYCAVLYCLVVCVAFVCLCVLLNVVVCLVCDLLCDVV